MPYLQPGQTFTALLLNAPEGIQASLGVKGIDLDTGTIVVPRVTPGISSGVVEVEPPSGTYRRPGLVAPTAACKFFLRWDNGPVEIDDPDVYEVTYTLPTLAAPSGAFTYDGTLDTTVEKVRLEIGDTDSTRPLFTDEEINYRLGGRGDDVVSTAADLCDILATRFARDFDFGWKDSIFRRSQRAEQYRKRAIELRARVGGGLAVMETTRVDGWSDDISTRDGAGASNAGRVRAGYTDPDLPA